MYRQGDVLLTRVAEGRRPNLEAVGRRQADTVVAYGEATGHAHVLEGEAVLYEYDGETYAVVGGDGATLTHDEHGPIALEAGTYRVGHQREYEGETRAGGMRTRRVWD